ncbi:flagellar hook-length control protein FliK [Enterobacter asburiae]|uniref:flagellar hook-length control protein FliK n=1 Tax=Scandinavium sp. UTDF21-P1B TaxID=3446379 RepID=UPI0034972C87
MNLDLTRLLSGGKDALPLNGELTSALSMEDFGLKLDEKLAEIGLATLPFAAELLAQLPQLPQLPAQALDAAPDADGEISLEGISLTEAALPEDVLAALVAESGEETPQWQLQQLVLRNATGKSDAVRPDVANPGVRPSAADVMSAVAGKMAKEDKPLPATTARTETTPVVVPASAPVMNGVEMPDSAPAQTVSVSPLTLPTVARPVTHAAPLPVATVSYPPEAPEWKPAVSQQIVMFARNGVQNAEIRLNPEELGSLHITLRLRQDQAQVHVVSEHAQVRHVMEQALPQLRSAMADSGIQLGQASVGADNPYASADGQGEQGAGDQQAQQTDDEKVSDEQIVPQLLTTTPGNVYGINTFA